MTKKRSPRKTKGVRVLIAALALLGVAAVSLLGWRWISSVRCSAVEIRGHRFAEEPVLRELAGVDTGMVLVEIDPELVADRVRRHPWVREAKVSRLPTGMLRIDVAERVPAAMVLGPGGSPRGYLDSEGFGMPASPGVPYDVPLLRGSIDFPHPTQSVQDDRLKELLVALGTATPEVDAIISEAAVGPDGIWIGTVPAPNRGSIRVRMGEKDFADKLERLGAFWHQAVLTQPDKRIELIDLRFNSQVVTTESRR